MYHTMMMHLIGAVHALVMNKNCISSLFHIHWNPLKDASGEPTINYTSSFNVIAYIDSKHYIK